MLRRVVSSALSVRMHVRGMGVVPPMGPDVVQARDLKLRADNQRIRTEYPASRCVGGARSHASMLRLARWTMTWPRSSATLTAPH